MPKLKQKDLNDIKYVSVGDLYSKLDQYSSVDEKLRYATRYLLHHDNLYNDYSLAGATSLARIKIAEAMKRENSNSVAAKLFLANPKEYLKGEANKLVNEIDEGDINYQGDEALKENCKNITKLMNDDFNKEVFDIDTLSKSRGLKARVEAVYGGKQGVNETFDSVKPKKWYQKLFGDSSKEWKALEQAYIDIDNPHIEEHGDFHYIYNSAIHYLQHKFPKWNPQQEFPVDQYNKLNATERRKVDFASSVFNAVKQHYQADENFHELVDANKGNDLKYSDIPVENNKVIDLDDNQIKFQNQLKEDVEKDFNIIDNYMDEVDKEKELENSEQIEDIAIPEAK